ncbi:MAG: type II secretion system protein [Tepidisphaeraceae bacterium]|jgi:Tfp pilus assembly protein PilX
MKQRRGYVLLEALMGLAMLGILAIAISLSAESQRRALIHLSDSRDACRSAESALTVLESGQSVPNPPEVSIKKLQDAPELPGATWMQSSANLNGRPADVIGLVPEENR